MSEDSTEIKEQRPPNSKNQSIKPNKKLFLYLAVGLLVLSFGSVSLVYFLNLKSEKVELKPSGNVPAAEQVIKEQIEALNKSQASISAEKSKEATKSPSSKNTYNNDDYSFKFNYPENWVIRVDKLSFQTQIQFNESGTGSLHAQLIIVPGGNYTEYYSRWLNSENNGENIGSINIDGVTATKVLIPNHVVHKKAYVFLWTKNNSLYNFFVRSSNITEAEEILKSLKYFK